MIDNLDDYLPEELKGKVRQIEGLPQSTCSSGERYLSYGTSVEVFPDDSDVAKADKLDRSVRYLSQAIAGQCINLVTFKPEGDAFRLIGEQEIIIHWRMPIVTDIYHEDDGTEFMNSWCRAVVLLQGESDNEL